MNFLAHLYLSGNRDGIMVGNFIGDFVRGRNLHEQFDAEIARGIELHRSIDEFTDRHPLVLESKKRLRPKYRHYAPVIVDVFYDHFLASRWHEYHALPLPEFAASAYRILKSHEAHLPDRVLSMLPYMIKGNWLVGYSYIEGIHQSLSGMAQRTPYDSKMNEASQELRDHYDEFGDEFARFFPDLKKLCSDFLSNNPNP